MTAPLTAPIIRFAALLEAGDGALTWHSVAAASRFDAIVQLMHLAPTAMVKVLDEPGAIIAAMRTLTLNPVGAIVEAL